VKRQYSRKLAYGALALALSASAAVPAQETAGRAPIDPEFQSMDQNGDGRVTRGEIPAEMVLLRTRFVTYDANHDNKLDPLEYAAAKAAMKSSGNAMGSDAPPTPAPRRDHR
jgi:hypothetical protein